jgi:YegS/Rv2252/BmrU family lipid kinase
MESIAAQLIRSGGKVLLAMGGDGTLQTVVNTPGACEVTIGILPAGSGNDFAAALGLPPHPVRALRALLEGGVRRVDLARARTADGRERLYCGGGGLGLDAEAARHSSQTYSSLPGRARYVISALHALRTFSPVTVRAEIPDQAPIEKRVLVAAALNTPSYGAGLRLADEATIDDGLLDLVFIEELGLRDIGGLLLDWAMHRALRSSRISHQKAALIKLSSDPPCLFHGDGELIGPASVEVEAVPGAIQVLVPERIGSE